MHLLMMTASWRSDFQAALAGAFAGAFTQVLFAIADCSPERRFLAPFAARLASQNPHSWTAFAVAIQTHGLRTRGMTSPPFLLCAVLGAAGIILMITLRTAKKSTHV